MKFLLLILILSSGSIKAQLIKGPIFYDTKIVKNTIDSLRKSGIAEILVIFTDKPFSIDKTLDSVKTFICWKQQNTYFIKIITANKIYIPFEFDGLKAFNFKQKKQTFVTPDEISLKFTPPLTNNNALFYFSKKNERYFEQPNNPNDIPATYYPTSKHKEQLRKLWFTQVLEILTKINFEDRIYHIYERPKEY